MAKVKVSPIGENVLVEVAGEEKKTKGGIFIPDTASKEKPQIGKVVAVGDSNKIKGVKKGDKIVFAKYSGSEVEIEGKEYLIIKFEEILAVVG